MKNRAIRGKYKPLNPHKYNGDIRRITYRSLWERRFMLYCDKSEQVTQWSSEELHIPYTSPKDNRTHNYYPDFLIHTIDGRTIMVEIKPKYQWRWDINQSKWNAAKDYCYQNNIEFKVMGQNELF